LRLQKYLAGCGYGSRRACERLIAAGRVAVDGSVVREQGVKVIPGEQEITVDGNPAVAEPLVYYLLNKPRDVLCTSHDPSGRRTIHELLPRNGPRVYNVGRLDRNSEGVLLVTNDGELAGRLMHPRYHVEKVYEVWSERLLTQDDEQHMLRGVESDEETLRADRVQWIKTERKGEHYRVVLHEGRNRQVRRMFEACGVQVNRLVRSAFGPLRLRGLRSGAHRSLREDEIRALRKAAGHKK
jgi:pseudouridine synthase